MPSSALTSGVPLYPRQAVPGVRSIYVSQITNLSGSVSVSSGSVVSIPFAVGSGSQFYQYNFPVDTAKWTQDGKAEQPNGAVKVEQTVDFELPWYQLATRNQLKQLAQVDCMVIVQNADSNYYLFGATRGMTLTDFKSDSGTKLGDFSGWKCVFKGSEPEEAFYVTGSLIPALLIPS
jgi:hypothetical protein